MRTRAAARVALLSCGVVVAMASAPAAQAPPAPAETQGSPVLAWPDVTQTARPWTRWWWQGSAVTPGELSAAMEAYRDAGLGGLELTPIYGVRGTERHFVRYLSPEWMSLLDHTIRESQRLGLGLDVATGTGWPFGGPWVTRDEACRNLVVKKYRVPAGATLAERVTATQEPILRAVGQIVYDVRGGILGPQKDDGRPQQERAPADQAGRRAVRIEDLADPTSANRNLQELALDQVRFPRVLPLVTLQAYSAGGEVIDLTSRVGPDGRLDWTAPSGEWTLYALFQGWHGKQVERAAPGGEGDVIDHFSKDALTKYLSAFDRAFAGHDVRPIRAFFDDSYEVDDASGQADWTPALLDEFKARRGYDLRRHIPALLGEETAADRARVLQDYRTTISDLLLENFTTAWQAWAAGRQALVRNQSHGAPGNILDLYAASDIPETEGTDLLRIRFASSAAHVTGKPLASAEAATWLDDHFLSSWGDVKQNVDRYFLGGVNHVVYHGTAYSPRDAVWPGWLFYASVHVQPSAPMWRDLRALNDYVARAQGFLQRGAPDADVLLYFPFSDYLAERGSKGLLQHFDGGGAIMTGTPFRVASEQLQARGYAFDYVSDRQVATLRATEEGIAAANARYQAIVIPETKYMPVETLERLIGLARDGATVIFAGPRPSQEPPGLANLEAKRAAMGRLIESVFSPGNAQGPQGPREIRVGRGRVFAGHALLESLARARVTREPMVERGLEFTRRRESNAVTYFIANRSDAVVDGWIPTARGGAGTVVFDPLTGRRGVARQRTGDHGAREVYLQLAPGETCVLRVTEAPVDVAQMDTVPSGERWAAYRAAGAPVELSKGWSVEFIGGGPQLPPAARDIVLRSWTEFGGDAARAFSGTARYRLALPRPAGQAAAWRLDLGRVGDSARVLLNGRHVGTVIGPGYAVTIEASAWQDRNVLDVEVSNLMANRISDMDRRGAPWKIFYNVNMPASRAENRAPNGLFDASKWEPRPSGLIGPVTLRALEQR